MSDINSVVGESVELPQEAPQEAPEQQAEQTQEQPQEQPQAEPEARVVPLAALHEERSKRRELAAQVEAERRTREEMERRFEQRLQALARGPAPAAPSLDENPLGHVVHKLDTLQAQQQALMQQSESERQASQRAAFEAQLVNRVMHDEQSFIAKTPDYNAAIAHMHQRRIRELQVLGMDEMAAESKSAAELKEFAFFTASQGKSPAQVAYELAKARGYNPQASGQDPTQRIQAAQRGTAAAASLGGGSSTTSGAPTARQLLAMSDDEFAAATSGDKWKKLMGAS